MRLTSPKLATSHLSRNEEVLERCKKALELKDAGEYYGAQEVMRPFWKGLDKHPDVTGLHPSVVAELLLCAGVLIAWIGSKNEDKQAQETAKDFISESITFYESVKDVRKIAAARAEIAYCYWYEGELNEARIAFAEALQKLTTEGNTRARALVGLARVEWSAARYEDAYEILSDNAHLFKQITNHTIKAQYHNQLAIILRERAKSEGKPVHLLRAVHEYEQADRHLKFTRNNFFRADLKNNIGNVLRQLNRHKEAHRYLEEARRLAIRVKDKLRVAQVDETRAQVLIAERRFGEAETVARCAVSVLAKSDRNGLLAEALITHGIILARLKQPERSQLCFQRAIAAALQVGALNKAGLAALAMIEELQQLDHAEAQAAFIRACQWLSGCQSKELSLRLIAVAEKIVSSLGSKLSAAAADEILLTKSPNLHKAVLKYEGTLIQQALARTNGSVTHAASLLGLSHQGLAYVIESRHPQLLKERTPIRRRGGKRKRPTHYSDKAG